ncbi:hypothetical protein HMPREF3232_00324 [Fannyhessea vaginae]|nr:hypothetical protein HMPREF3232_00324 [Fannyhessea vaginae]
MCVHTYFILDICIVRMSYKMNKKELISNKKGNILCLCSLLRISRDKKLFTMYAR